MFKPMHNPQLALGLAILCLPIACDPEPSLKPASDPPKTSSTEKPRKTEIGANIFLEVEGDKRRVLVSGTVCLQRGALELLLTRKDTKEHEAVLSADIDARVLRTALTIAGAKPGAPVKFDPVYRPASGSVMKITLEYANKDGKLISDRAQDWIKDSKTGKPLTHDWVFAGSRLVPNPLDNKKPIFLANDGDVVCVSNFETALLDLPIKSSKDNQELAFEVNADRVPPLGTKVTIIFEAVPEK